MLFNPLAVSNGAEGSPQSSPACRARSPADHSCKRHHQLSRSDGPRVALLPHFAASLPDCRRKNALICKVGIHRTLRFWIPFPDRYTDLPISYRDLGTLNFRNSCDVFGCVDEAPLAFAPSVTLCNGHHFTPAVRTARLGTPPNERHNLDRTRPGLACTRPFAPASMN